jgi:diacylglycerol kinase
MIQSRFTHALRGLSDTFTADPSIQLHSILALGVLLMGVFACLSPESWAILFLSIGAVLAAELGNSALERLADRVYPNRDLAIRRAKDVAAGAVLVVALVTGFVGILLFLPPVFSKTAGSCLLL